MRSQPLSAARPAGTGLRAALRSRSRVARSAWAIARGSVLTGGLALVIFHIVLFRDRLVGGDLFDPAVALRWLAAVGLVSALEVLRRMGVPLARGRKAFVVWLLVVLLHASGRGVPVAPAQAGTGVDARLLFVLPTVVGLGLLCAIQARRRLAAYAAVGRRVDPDASCRLRDGWRRGGTTRAPPIAAF
jgi:hypothetical protein